MPTDVDAILDKCAHEYSQGIYGNSSAILKNGQPITIDIIVSELKRNAAAAILLREVLELARKRVFNLGVHSEKDYASNETVFLPKIDQALAAAAVLMDGGK